MKSLFLLFLLSFSIMSISQAQNLSTFQKKTFLSAKGDNLPYRMLLPENFDKDQSYPLILFLHGAGERGNDNELQLVHGAKLFLENIEKHPAIVVFPQCPENVRWSNVDWDSRMEDGSCNMPFSEKATRPMELVLELIDNLLITKSIDNSRIYLCGLSMGGFGSFDLLARKPDFFAAAIPICGGGNPLVAKLYADNTAMWIFHGDADVVVPVEGSRKMYQVLKELGANVRYTEYPGVNHNSWDKAFAEPSFLEWLFSQKK
ncbi:MAG: alpha/beta hydrolase-fold protein [Saprospiraceae bacterium]|jgi:predicted peptidase|nr:alpha/beta hydrolase-fold protein [Saprospiraceae bacterium]